MPKTENEWLHGKADVCVWVGSHFSAGTVGYHTSCDGWCVEPYQFDDYKFCPYCGKRIEEKAASDTETRAVCNWKCVGRMGKYKTDCGHDIDNHPDGWTEICPHCDGTVNTWNE